MYFISNDSCSTYGIQMIQCSYHQPLIHSVTVVCTKLVLLYLNQFSREVNFADDQNYLYLKDHFAATTSYALWLLLEDLIFVVENSNIMSLEN